MREIKPPTAYGKETIIALRKELGYTQSVFAKVLGVSTKAVEAWECGRNIPADSTCRLLQILQAEKELVEKLVFL